jgi:hypothetical protein
MENTVQTLIADLLEWIGPTPRSYAEVQDVWRTSCPKLPLWEDAVDAGLLDSWFESGPGFHKDCLSCRAITTSSYPEITSGTAAIEDPGHSVW